MPEAPNRVLVVDDELAMRRALSASLTVSGYRVEHAASGEEAIGLIRRQPFDLVLLDINMAGMGGIDVCRRIRPLMPNAGIIMITVSDTLEDKVKALDAGADDYITKPFLLRELLARLRALMRRTRPEPVSETDPLRAGALELDIGHRLLRKAGREIRLSPTEFDLLAYFMQHPGIPIEHSKLLQAIWGPEYGSELEYLRSYVRFLRKKIEANPARPEYILTEPWVGYRFRDPSDAGSPPPGPDDDSVEPPL
jgi:two-component system, OmpR family, KDP operon response regulator KdpE